MIEYIQTLIEKNIFNNIIELLQENEFGFKEDIDNIHVQYLYKTKVISLRDKSENMDLSIYYNKNLILMYRYKEQFSGNSVVSFDISYLKNVKELSDDVWFMFNIEHDTKNYPREFFEYCVNIYNLLK